jgi:hypothetical protein
MANFYATYPFEAGSGGGGGSGTVTSVALTTPGVLYSVSGSPITTSGTLALNLISQAQNSFLAGPTSGSGNPSFRAIVVGDIPILNQNTTGTASNVTGTVAIANGGTGSTTQNFVDLTTNQASIAGNKTFTGTTTDTGNSLIAQATASKATIGLSGSTAIHEINGGIDYTTKTITSSTYTVDTTSTDYIIYTDSTSNAITITLPVPTNGRFLIIQDKTGQASTNNITIKQNASETLNGLTQYVLAQNYNGLTITSDGTNWSVLSIPASGSFFITSGTTYTTPVNITPQTRFKFTLVGAGGGGGGINTNNANGSGGGGGGCAVVELTGLAANTAYTLTIGAAGSGGISTTTPATNGGNTTLTVGATTYTASGGSLGADTVDTAGGTGGNTTNATIGIRGQAGGFSNAALANSASGYGGASGMSFGYGGTATGLAGNGFNATGFGGGGGSGKGAAATGGNGTAGCIFVEWWN